MVLKNTLPRSRFYIYLLLFFTFVIFFASTLVTYEKYNTDFIKNEESAQNKMTKIIHQSLNSYFDTLRILVENAVLNSAYNDQSFNFDDEKRFSTTVYPQVLTFLEKAQILTVLKTPKAIDPNPHLSKKFMNWQIYKGLPEYDNQGRTLALERRKIARNILKTFKDIHYVFEMEPDGNLVFLEPFDIQKNISSFNYEFRDYLRIVKNTRATGVSEGYISHDQSRTQIITVATPIFDTSNRVAKLLAVSVSAATLRDRVFKSLKENMDVQDGTVFYLIDRHGHVVASSNGKNIYFPTDGAASDEKDSGNIRNTGLFRSIVWKPDTLEQGNIYERRTQSWDTGSLKNHMTEEYVGLTGEDVVATFMPASILGTETVNWGILVETPKNQLLSSERILKHWFYFFAAMLICILSFFSYLIFRQFNKLELALDAKEKEIIDLSSQVAHDIRSPLAALNLVISDLSELPEKKRLLIRSAVGRIKDIANDLVNTSSRNESRNEIQKQAATETTVAEPPVAHKDKHIPLLILNLIEEVVTEKRIQLRSYSNVVISTHFSLDSADAFIRAETSGLKRAISNIITNSVESMKQDGDIQISLFLHGDKVVLQIKDSGAGIPHEILPKLMIKGATFNKTNGSGRGLYHAKEVIQSLDGDIQITSHEGKGTTVTLEIPKITAPAWYPQFINIQDKKNIVILDDDESIHLIWSERLSILATQNLIHFNSSEQLEEWLAYHKDEKNIYLVDYELLGQNTNGLEIIKKFKIESDSILVTSRYNEFNIIRSCLENQIYLVPKSLAGFIPILSA